MVVNGFDWDDGNWPKCGKHGLSKEAIERALSGEFIVFDDPHDPDVEMRYRAICPEPDGRMLFAVFCLREKQGQTLIRPISARYMHQDEIEHYERQSEED